jgi:hypothetical protein
MIPNTTAKTPKIHTSATRPSLGHTASNTPKTTERALAQGVQDGGDRRGPVGEGANDADDEGEQEDD